MKTFNELSQFIESLKQRGVSEISFTLKFSDASESSPSVETSMSIKPAKPLLEIPAEMMMGEL